MSYLGVGNEVNLMRLLFILSFFVLFSACQQNNNPVVVLDNSKGLNVESISIFETEKIDTIGINEYWLKKDIASATLYIYNPIKFEHKAFGNLILNKEDELSPYIIDSLTTELELIEVNKLKKYIITETTFRNQGAECFDPHHGIILRNSKKEIIGDISICFQCNNYRFQQSHKVSYIPIYFFRKIVKNHNLPINRNEIYRLYRSSLK